MQRVLFLCTGNYYRSRFAEHLFNQLATERGMAWHADSCGLRVRPDGVTNVGALSVHAREGMQARGIPFEEPCRFPRQVTIDDLGGAAMVIALKESEHRHLMEALHPGEAGRVQYWEIHDRDVSLPAVALVELDARVRQLVDELALQRRELAGP